MCDTAKYFDRDPETNEVLWFAAPPVDIAHPPGPRYSLEYLHFLARKRKAAAQDVDAMEIDAPRKKVVQPTTTERLSALLATLPMDTTLS